MKIWIANSDTENEGARSRLFFSARDVNEYARDWVRDFVSTGTREDITAENWPTFYDRLQDRPSFMDHLHIEDYDLLDHPVMAEIRGVIDGLMTQIDQMSGMFSDSDGSIQAAMDDAETLLERLDPHQGKATQTEAMGQIVTDTMARHDPTKTACDLIREIAALERDSNDEFGDVILDGTSDIFARVQAVAAVLKWREDHPDIAAAWQNKPE